MYAHTLLSNHKSSYFLIIIINDNVPVIPFSHYNQNPVFSHTAINKRHFQIFGSLNFFLSYF